jgi:hypothetical protein
MPIRQGLLFMLLNGDPRLAASILQNTEFSVRRLVYPDKLVPGGKGKPVYRIHSYCHLVL